MDMRRRSGRGVRVSHTYANEGRDTDTLRSRPNAVPTRMLPDSLVARIEAGEPSAPAEITDTLLGQFDARNRSLFDIALASDHREAIVALAARKATHGVAAQPRDELKVALRHMLASLDPRRGVARLETELRRSFGDDLGLQRTPLLQACRHGHAFAIEQLLQAGAKPAGKDLLGLTEAELCLDAGGLPLLDTLVGLCRRHKRKLVLSEGVIEHLLRHPQALQTLTEHAELTTGAKRLLLCLHCARLDVDRVAALLQAGLDPNIALHKHAHAVFEACTSNLLLEHMLADWLPLAWRLARQRGAPGTHAIVIEPNGDADIATRMATARAEARERQAQLDAFQLGEADLAAQTATRLQLIEMLFEAGLDPTLVRKKAPDFWIRDLLGLQQPALVQALQARGVDLQPQDYERDAIPAEQLAWLDMRAPPSGSPGQAFLLVREPAARWELTGETSLLAAAWPAPPLPGQPFVARVSVCNSYGPIDDCQIHVRGSGTADWQPMHLREELIDTDGELRQREPDESPAGEAPWSATFELECMRGAEQSTLQIRIRAASEDIDGVVTDWALS